MKNEFRIADCGLRIAGILILLLALAAPALAKSPWENLAGLMGGNGATKTAAAQTSRSLSATALPPANGALPALREVPDETAATSMTGKSGSAAMALAAIKSAVAKETDSSGDAQSRDAQALGLGRESDDNESMRASDLFRNKDIRRLLGDEPRFVYNPEQRPDPMTVPWVRRAAIFKELSSSAEALVAQNKLTEAVKVYQRILDLNDPRYVGIVQTKLNEIATKESAAARAVAAATAPRTEIKIELPAWVSNNTTGVIIAPGANMCLVGKYLLHSGDAVPNNPEVRVAEIGRGKVVYQIKDKKFEVKLNIN